MRFEPHGEAFAEVVMLLSGLWGSFLHPILGFADTRAVKLAEELRTGEER